MPEICFYVCIKRPRLPGNIFSKSATVSLQKGGGAQRDAKKGGSGVLRPTFPLHFLLQEPSAPQVLGSHLSWRRSRNRHLRSISQAERQPLRACCFVHILPRARKPDDSFQAGSAGAFPPEQNLSSPPGGRIVSLARAPPAGRVPGLNQSPIVSAQTDARPTQWQQRSRLIMLEARRTSFPPSREWRCDIKAAGRALLFPFCYFHRLLACREK